MEDFQVEALFNNLYRPLVYRANVVWGVPIEDAEDVVMAQFYKIVANKIPVLSKAQFSTYLYKMVLNGCSTFHHKNKMKSKMLSDVSTEEESVNPINEMIRNEYYATLFSAVDSLPTRCREIISMRFIKQLSVKEIAQHLSLSENTVKNQIGRGIKQLRKKFNLSEVDIKENKKKFILRLLNSGSSSSKQGKIFGISRHTLRRVRVAAGI